LVHDYLREYGGAERVLEALHQLFPEAPVYVAFIDRQALGRHAARFDGWSIRETWMAKLPLIHRLFSPYRIFAPRAFADLDLSAFDVVITSTNAYFAKNIHVRAGAKHVCYCHTPARSLYGYTTMTDWRSNPFTQFVGTLMNHYLRVVDVQAAQKVDQFIANSHTVQARIQKFYRRDAVVIHPPVRVPAHPPKNAQREYFLFVNRLAFSKHPELAIQASIFHRQAFHSEHIRRLAFLNKPVVE
jgi:glycosyltransferase involved in cell wall biosynthesis